MKLKCIGGVRDGEYIYVDHYYKIGDYIRLPEKIKPIEYNPDKIIPEELIVKYDMYKVSCLHFSKDDFIMFAIPVNWTNKEAILFQLNK